MQRFDFAELAVMLATAVRWLVLATLTGALVGSGTSLHGPFCSEVNLEL